ncbi:MAG: protein-export chaperone SecB [Proteobacteria bacterium]|nr:protein-export chaperone SecB [Pseudomonadota bacterium]
MTAKKKPSKAAIKQKQPQQQPKAENNNHEEINRNMPAMVRHHSYIADLSFETFDVSKRLMQGAGNMGVSYAFDVSARQVGDYFFTVALLIKTKAEAEPGDVAMLLEMRYEGLFEIRHDIKDEGEIKRLMLVDAVEMMFPYTVNVISNVTRESGFAPVAIERIDFAKVFEERERTAQTVN